MYQQYEPIDPRDAFSVAASPDSEGTQDAAASQAAFLLSTRAGVLGVDAELESELGEAKNEGFELPEMRPLERTHRLKVDEATERLGMSTRELAQEKPSAFQDEMTRVVRDLYDQPTIDSAAALFEGSMKSDHPLVAVAGAAGARETTRLRKEVRRILEDGCVHSDPLVAGVAKTALSQHSSTSSAVRKYVGERPEIEKRDRRSNTAVVTHGTWAGGNAWYQAGGDYHAGLSQQRPDVHNPSFTWSGGYSHGARQLASVDLRDWLDGQGLPKPDFFAHSHGGTVAHLATHRGVTFKKLVLMGWPVHTQWFPDFNNVEEILDVRVRLDLVILADRGGQRFRPEPPNFTERRHGWFSHSSTHESSYWTEHGLWGLV